MDEYEVKLLKFAYNNYQNTNSRYCEYPMRSSEEFLYLTEAAHLLSEEDYILPLSDNICNDTVLIINNSEIQNNDICFELTDKGLEYCVNLFAQ